MRNRIALFVAVGLLAAACSGTDATSTTRAVTGTTSSPGTVTGVAGSFDPSQIQFVAALQRFDSCDALLGHFKAEARERVGPYGLEGSGPVWPMFEERGVMEDSAGEAEATTTAPAAAPAAEGASQEGVDYSGTNVQVAGVDEPDIVKTDGERIVSIVDGKLTYVDVTGDEPVVAGRLQLTDGWGHSLFVVGDTAFVFSSGGGVIGIPTDLAARGGLVLPPYSVGSTIVSEVDLSDPGAMKVTRSLTLEGSFLSARLVDGTVRVIVSSYPSDLPFVYPSSEAAEDVALETNRRIVETTTLEDWLPEYTLVESDGSTSEGLLVDCARTHRPAEFAGFETLSVLSFQADDGVHAGDGTAVIASGETVYASTESIYVATNVWVPPVLFGTDDLAEVEESYSTAVHRFSISSGEPAEYEASGTVRGHLLNQFAMDEYEGRLRVATTDGPPWGFDEESESFITVLEQRGDRLMETGRVGDMGRGERIYSVRFIGEAAYVVTFRQTDPLYVVDLSDPAAPAVSGELKIPGYSAYLHPLGDGRLLGVGQDADEDGRTRGAKVSVFDVSDPADPREVSTWTLKDSYTDAEWDHHAFLYWAPEQIMVMPLQNWQEDFAGAIVFKLDDGIREFGRISHEDPEGPGVASECEQFETVEGFEDAIVQVCGPNEASAIDGRYCEVVPLEEAQWLEEYLGRDVDLEAVAGPDDHIEICWPDYSEWNPIQRSLVIGEDLWTLSWRALQSNSLDDLAVLHQVPLG